MPIPIQSNHMQICKHAHIHIKIKSHKSCHVIIISNIKISSLGLMIKNKQFDLNYFTKPIFSQIIFCEITVSGTVKPSFTVPIKHKSSVHFVNLYFSAISGLNRTNT